MKHTNSQVNLMNFKYLAVVAELAVVLIATTALATTDNAFTD
jgi:hypothetical protein